MERARLEQAAELLQGLDSGIWLQAGLAEISKMPKQPRVIVLVSSQEAIERVFPSGLQFDARWAVWDSTEALEPPLRDMADVILWGMRAMVMFPDDYKVQRGDGYTALCEQAESEQIPIWAIVVGLDQMSEIERARFVRRDVNECRRRLPKGSHILLVEDPIKEHQRIQRLLREESVELLKIRAVARRKWLAEEVLKRLPDERKALREKLMKANTALRTSRQGSESLKPRSRAVAFHLLQEYNQLYKALDRLKRDLHMILEIEEYALEVDVELAVQAIAQNLEEWSSVTLRSELARCETQAQQYITKWCNNYRRELQYFLSYSRDLIPNEKREATTIEFDTLALLSETSVISKRINEEIWRKFELFSHLLQHDIHTLSSPLGTIGQRLQDTFSRIFSQQSRDQEGSYENAQIVEGTLSEMKKDSKDEDTPNVEKQNSPLPAALEEEEQPESDLSRERVQAAKTLQNLPPALVSSLEKLMSDKVIAPLLTVDQARKGYRRYLIERATVMVDERCEELQKVIRTFIQEQEGQLTTLLEEALDEQGALHFELSLEGVNDMFEKFERIDRAEELLRS